MKRDRFWKGPYRTADRGDAISVSSDERFTLSRPMVDWKVVDIATGETFENNDLRACMEWIKERNP